MARTLLELKILLSLTHITCDIWHLKYMCTTWYNTVLPMLWWTHFDDIWTTTWWIVWIKCAVFQNETCEVSINRELQSRIFFTLWCQYFCVVESEICSRENFTENLEMLARPRTPSPSACCGNGCSPCVMDLHQQVLMKSGIKTWVLTSAHNLWNFGCRAITD